MDLKDMVVMVVYQSKQGMLPVEIVDAVNREYKANTNTKAVIKLIEKNPGLFAQANGRFKSPAEE